MSWASSFMSLFRGHLPTNKIAVLPNVKNRIVRCLPENARNEPEIGGRKVLFEVSSNWLYPRKSRSAMAKSIVESALKVIEQKVFDRIEDERYNELLTLVRDSRQQMAGMEQQLADIADELKALRASK